MKRIILEIKTESEEYEQQIEIGKYQIDDISVRICLNGRNFLDILKDKELFIQSKENGIEMLKSIGEDTSDFEENYDYVLNKFNNLLDNIESIVVDEKINLKEFIKQNPILKTKKIVIKQTLDITDFEQLQKLTKEYEGINIYVYLAGNYEYISLETCKKTMNYIKNIGDQIKSLNLSPFETIIFVYDIVRDRYYQFENKDERYSKSRDLSEVLFGSAIVCSGYAELFKAILNYIGIETNITKLEGKKEDRGHARNEIKIVDSKYNIDGFYYFDTTWDSKIKGKEDEFLLRYKCLAKTRDEMERLEKHDFIYEQSPKYSHNIVDEFIEILENEDFINYYYYTKTFNYISKATNSRLTLEPEYFLRIKI